jgi:hypothetical protein
MAQPMLINPVLTLLPLLVCPRWDNGELATPPASAPRGYRPQVQAEPWQDGLVSCLLILPSSIYSFLDVLSVTL